MDQFTDYLGNVQTKETLQKRLDAIPGWYFQRDPATKERLQTQLNEGKLEDVFDAIDYIEFKIEDWVSD